MRFTVSYCSERGKNKKKCEDSVLIGHNAINEEAGTADLQSPCWVCLCDGVGGYAGGQEASLFVARELSTAGVPHDISDIRGLFTGVNSRLIERAQKTADHKMMGTTATALFLSDDSFYMAHVGNTRLYAVRNASISQITLDHTLYQWFTDHGLKLFANERNRDVIYGGMGGSNQKRLRPLVVEKLPENLMSSGFLLTSDGVHESLSKDEIEEILGSDTSAQDKAKMLCCAALEHGSEDDRTAIIICAEDIKSF